MQKEVDDLQKEVSLRQHVLVILPMLLQLLRVCSIEG